MDHKDKKTFEKYLYSVVGIAGMLAVLIAVNMLFGSCSLRLDATQEDLFTLTEGTRQILKEMDTPVAIRFYFSKDVAQMPPALKTYAERVQDLLKEYRQHGGDNIEITRLNPTPDSDAEDSANLDGVTGQPLGAFGTGDMLYLGLAVSCFDETVAIPFLSPERENLLEYDITRALYRVLHPEKVKVGVISSLPVMGRTMPPQMMMQMPNMQNQPPWQVIAELRRDVEVVELQSDAGSIDEDIRLLLLIHPKDLKDKTLYAIDQFLLRGGKILAFLDPMSMVESQNQQQMQFMPPGASTLGKLLDAWGITFDTEKVIADTVYMARIRRRQDAPPEAMPMVLNLHTEAIDPEDPATGQLDNLLFVFGGAFAGDGAEGIAKAVLLRTSESVQPVEKFMAQASGDRVIREFKSLEMAQALAIRLTGSFKTAFPDGKPEDDAASDSKDAEGDEAKDAAAESLKESATESAVILVGDSDMIFDHFCVQRGNFLGTSFLQPINDNLAMVQNMVEQLSGDTRLISIRSRGAINRPLEAIAKLQARAEQDWQEEIKSLEDELQEARTKISELQREKGTASDKAFISQETQEAIRKFRQKEAETSKQLKLVRKKLRRDIDFLENSVTWLNILVMPIVVALGGLGLALFKRQRMVRK
ncbi:MAG: Gldg family protein [Lentisphaeria bacterium]|nr:Gldg family protein [Lentisphaeria bacterium]